MLLMQELSPNEYSMVELLQLSRSHIMSIIQKDEFSTQLHSK